MSKNKQPRDENGKFMKKLIKITDKFGNTAYFSPEEMAGFKATPKNPDCEPATRGYVKELMRKYSVHKHEQNGDCSIIFVATLASWLITSILFCDKMFNTHPHEALDIWLVSMFLTSVVLTILIYEINYIVTNLTTNVKNEPIAELQKYTPPRKDECEEENGR